MVFKIVAEIRKWILESIALLLLLSSTQVRAEDNVWTNSVGGNWEDSWWSLGHPGGSAIITNEGSKTIIIGPTAWTNYPESLDGVSLTLSAPSGSTNRLLIEPGDAPIAFRTGGAGGTTIGPNGVLENRGATLRLFGSVPQIDGILIQSGGVLESNEPYVSGRIFLTNVMSTIYGFLRLTYSGEFQQFGGTNNAPDVACSGTYRLSDGMIYAGAMHLGVYGGGGSFYESGGTVSLSNLVVGYAGRFGGGRGRLFLNSGILTTGNATVGPEGEVSQVGGLLSVSNQLKLSGLLDIHGAWQGRYTLADGHVTTTDLIIDQSAFIQTGGSNHIADSLIITPYDSYYGGMGSYTLSGGQLTASNIFVSGTFSCEGATGSYRISNPGYFSLSGVFLTGGNSEQLGRFVPSSGRAVVDMGFSATLRFADSSEMDWTGYLGGGATLIISNWNGSVVGGGNSQLFFGTNASGITADQLARIQFAVPNGLPAGNYHAKILETGEVVPKTDMIFYKAGDSNLVLNWYGLYALQTATNVDGPYFDVSVATNSYTNVFLDSPRQFFRLRP